MNRNKILGLFLGVLLLGGCATNEVDTDRIDDTLTAVVDRTVNYLSTDTSLDESTRANRVGIAESFRRRLSSERRVKVDVELAGTAAKIREWHDAYVMVDPGLAEYQREGAMISSEVLVATLEEAAGIDRRALDRVGK